MVPPRVSGLRRLGALLQRAHEPVFVLDGQRRLIFANRAWEELTGFAFEAVAGLECPPTTRPAPDDERQALGACLCPPPEATDGRPAGGPTLIPRAGGERLWRRVEYWPYHDAAGGLIALFGLIRPFEAAAVTLDSAMLRLRAELQELRERHRARYGTDALVGRGPAHRRLLDQVRAAAATRVPALIAGEPGTGKRTVARVIHQLGGRPQAPLVPFDCAALPPEVLQRELFGAAEAGRPPRLNLPDEATVLLIHVLELPRDLQAHLAETLAGRVRLLATSPIAPEPARRQGRLRPELYYALTTLVLELEPLRDRLEELPLLAQHLLERANLRSDRRRFGFEAEALQVLAEYDWPGNLRELARVIESAHERATGELIRPEDLPAAIRGALGAAYLPPPMPPKLALDEMLTQIERRLIESALKRARQNKSRAAELLDISRPRLYRRIKELNIPDDAESAENGPGAARARGAD